MERVNTERGGSDRPTDTGRRGRTRRTLSAKRARYEAWHAKIYRTRLPKGHPYALIPEWMPYPLACLVGRIHSLMPGRR